MPLTLRPRGVTLRSTENLDISHSPVKCKCSALKKAIEAIKKMGSNKKDSIVIYITQNFLDNSIYIAVLQMGLRSRRCYVITFNNHNLNVKIIVIRIFIFFYEKRC